MAGLNETTSGNRIHIAFFGRRNAGKSTLVNALTGQEIAIVSDVAGTTTDPVSKDNCKVRVVARALKEMQPDTSDWSFAIEGATSDTLSISSVTSGEVIGEIVVGENVDFNGFGLAMGEGDTLKWSVPGTEKSGTVADAKIESAWTRLTVTGDALSELASAEYNGKMITFVLKVGNATVSKSATLKVA